MSERDKRIAKDPTLTLEQAVKNKGYYDINHNWNPLITSSKYPGLIFRPRVEVLIFDEKNRVYILPYTNNTYRLPGGGIARDRGKKYQVSMEAKEEAKIILGEILDTGITYFKFFNKTYDSYKFHWDGTMTTVFVAGFKNWYTGSVAKSVRDDDMFKYGRFIPLSTAMGMFNKQHKAAAMMWKHRTFSTYY